MSQDIFSVIASRRSVRRFQPRPVETDKLLQIIQAGVLAPSSGNIQNWSFILVTDVDKIRQMYILSMEQEPFLTAMAAIVVIGDTDHAHAMYGMRGKRLYTIQNCAAAIQNMLLASHALGIGASWVGAFEEDALSHMLDIPAGKQRPQAIILLGYPNSEPEPKQLTPLADMVFFNSFGNRVQKPHLIFYDWATEWRLQAQKVKSHMQQVAHSVKARNEKKIEEKIVENPEQESKRKSVQDIINRLKKEQYRK